MPIVFDNVTIDGATISYSLDISGGVVSYDNDYTIRTFYTSGNLTVVGSGTLPTEYLVVGSGANGANGTLGVLSGGGGGAGGVRTGNVIISAGVYPVDVGLNAAGNGTSQLTVVSQFFWAQKGDNAIGPNGGDSGQPSNKQGSGGSSLSGGGGGGSFGNATAGPSNVGDNGGSGTFSSITGINQGYAGGGGGGGRDDGGSGATGAGKGASLTANATVPTSYGSGGGGGYQNPDSGGRPATLGKDGIVIVRYLTSGTTPV